MRVAILDDERLLAAITPVEDSVVEGGDAVFEVWLPGGVTTEPTDLRYTLSGTADAGDDYTAPDGTLRIPAGRDTGTITVSTLDDAKLDPDETVAVTLTSAVSGSRDALIPVPVATVTILDPGTITVSVAPTAATEGGTLSFGVTLSQASADDITVEWETAHDPESGTPATAGIDYLGRQRHAHRGGGGDFRHHRSPQC